MNDHSYQLLHSNVRRQWKGDFGFKFHWCIQKHKIFYWKNSCNMSLNLMWDREISYLSISQGFWRSEVLLTVIWTKYSLFIFLVIKKICISWEIHGFKSYQYAQAFWVFAVLLVIIHLDKKKKNTTAILIFCYDH
jgi:hypothetical protein